MYSKDVWQPTADLKALKFRAEVFHNIRRFFYQRDVLEVDTPCLSLGTISDPHIEVLTCQTRTLGQDVTYYLQTSPEYAMKRLLAAGVPSIYQLGKVFRAEEIGRRHSIEFTMLEWYRLGFDHWQLMREMDDLLTQLIGQTIVSERLSYAEAFVRYVGVNPFSASLAALQQVCHQHTEYGLEEQDRDTLLELLFATLVEPNIGQQVPCFIHAYPASQAALAKQQQDEQGNATAARFEWYWQGMELANGYFELTDAAEQQQRMHEEMAERAEQGQVWRQADERLISALERGLPECAGVALGVDRLLMLLQNKAHIEAVMPFAGPHA
ncbi:Elongation factor P--(R)-beta-lysine ligase [Marinomonas aquimarina]|uniref:Elongation factor P--(R)-beta-lysine ligase n=1 Tax=Marinomonas aquimarina TaxID=295068 RepID=A0A1A8T9E8_9GAMM|nr:EF-P lysine aminoacylase EpmA [Marinomonas aquimarina]SBS28217.1 Elongation factor P--(R)-beta-lysine ligase [Marinomonas aquimarina]